MFGHLRHFLSPKSHRIKHASFFSNTSMSQQPLRISKLPNGLRVASIDDVADSCFASFGVYIDAGARHEEKDTFGVSQILPHMAFKGSVNEPDLPARVARLGGHLYSLTTREHLLFQGSVLRENFAEAISLLSESVCRDEFSTEEVSVARSNVLFNFEEAKKHPPSYLRDYLFSAAYPDSQISINHYAAPAESYEKISNKSILKFCQSWIRPERTVVVVAGIENHQEVVDLVYRNFFKNNLPLIESSSKVTTSAPEYHGGSSRHIIAAPPPSHPNACKTLSYVQIALPGPPCTDVLNGLACHTLQFMMGGGDAFSSGGPGKGMYSRLFTNVLNRNRFVESCTSFYDPLADAALFGITAACTPELNRQILSIVAAELENMVRSPPDTEELARAKNQLRSFMFSALESQLVRVENAGLQLLTRNEFTSPNEVDRMIRELDPSALQCVASKMLDQQPTCTIMAQSLDGFPSPTSNSELHSITKRFLPRISKRGRIIGN